MNKRKTTALLLAILLLPAVSTLIDGFEAHADISTVKAAGTLTSIEDDGSVIINEKGYQLDPSVVVINRMGKNISIRSLSLPAKVRFEYRYAKTGFIIVLIEEVKIKGAKKKKNRR